MGPATAPRRVLLAGIARSGTTWIANALSHCADATLVHEPDNDRHHVHAMAAKARLGRYPVLRPGDRAPAYTRLFEVAFTDPRPDPVGDRRRALARRLVGDEADAVNRVMADPDGPWPARLRAAYLATTPPSAGDPPPGPRIVKTVHAPLAADWLVDALRPDAALVVVRHPANVVGSWRDLGWDLRTFPWRSEAMWQAYGPPEGNPGPGVPDDFATRGAWHFALVANALVLAAERHALPVVDHEDVLAAPAARLAELAGSLGLTWTDESEAWVRDRDQPGEGYEIHRVAADERGRWRSRLPADELALVADVVGRFPRLRDRWDLTPAPPASAPARARWVVGPVQATGPDPEGWHTVAADVDGTETAFSVHAIAPALRPEAFLTFMTPPAVGAGADLETAASVDPTWAAGVDEAAGILAPWLGAEGRPTIHAPRAAVGDRPSQGRTGLCFTGGVDSFWSLLRGGHDPTDLVYVWSYDLPLDDDARGAVQRAMLEDVAATHGLGVVHVRTAARRHPHVRHVAWGFHHGAALGAVGLVLSDHLDRLVIPPSYPASSTLPWGSSSHLDPLWSVPGAIEIVHPASGQVRLDRVLEIADEPLVHRHLRVCWERLEPGVNCGRCEKCVRTMVMLTAAGRLDDVQTLPDAEDLPAAIAALVPLPPHSLEFWRPLVDERVPAPVRQAVQAALDASPGPA